MIIIKRGIMDKQEMRATSRSVQRLELSGDAPYKDLANAIICVSADDYRAALINKNHKLINSLERFFKSNWYKLLTNVDSNIIINKIKNEITYES